MLPNIFVESVIHDFFRPENTILKYLNISSFSMTMGSVFNNVCTLLTERHLLTLSTSRELSWSSRVQLQPQHIWRIHGIPKIKTAKETE